MISFPDKPPLAREPTAYRQKEEFAEKEGRKISGNITIYNFGIALTRNFLPLTDKIYLTINEKNRKVLQNNLA